MDRIQSLGVLGFLLYFACYACATLSINGIIGPDSVEDGSVDELILDCDFDANGEEEVVVKWFVNGLEEQIYQWITSANQAYAIGAFKDIIDTQYKATKDPKTMYRALRFKEVSPALSGNYSCKISSEDADDVETKQVIIYSPATSFTMFLIGGDDEFKGDEVVLCDVANVSPKPNFDMFVAGLNGSALELPEMFNASKKETSMDGFYNISITLPFNSSYLDEGTTKFLCQLSIPGTNYSESKSVEHSEEPEIETEPTDLLYEEDYIASLNSNSSSNSTEEIRFEENGDIHLHSSLVTVLFLLLSLVMAT